METTRAAWNAPAGSDLVDPGRRPPAARIDADVAAAARDAARAAAVVGDARAAFDAAALAVAATAGRDLTPLTRLCERGVAASNAHPDGGFASIDRDAAARLAPGAIKDACLDASRSRRAPAPIRAIRAPEGADAHLGWMATAAMAAERFESGPAGVVGVVGVPPREVARAATLTRGDWLGRRVEGSGAGWAELDGDTTEDARRTGRDASRGFSGASAGSPSAGSPSAGSPGVGSPGGIPGSAGFTFDASRRFSGPGPEPETVPAAAVTPAPPAFTPAPPARGFVRHPDDDEKGNDWTTGST